MQLMVIYALLLITILVNSCGSTKRGPSNYGISEPDITIEDPLIDPEEDVIEFPEEPREESQEEPTECRHKHAYSKASYKHSHRTGCKKHIHKRLDDENFEE